MALHHALGPSGGAGGVEQVGHAVGRYLRKCPGGRQVEMVEMQDRAVRSCKHAREIFMRLRAHNHVGANIVEDGA